MLPSRDMRSHDEVLISAQGGVKRRGQGVGEVDRSELNLFFDRHRSREGDPYTLLQSVLERSREVTICCEVCMLLTRCKPTKSDTLALKQSRISISTP